MKKLVEKKITVVEDKQIDRSRLLDRILTEKHTNAERYIETVRQTDVSRARLREKNLYFIELFNLMDDKDVSIIDYLRQVQCLINSIRLFFFIDVRFPSNDRSKRTRRTKDNNKNNNSIDRPTFALCLRIRREAFDNTRKVRNWNKRSMDARGWIKFKRREWERRSSTVGTFWEKLRRQRKIWNISLSCLSKSVWSMKE